jgi:hypothetical protein
MQMIFLSNPFLNKIREVMHYCFCLMLTFLKEKTHSLKILLRNLHLFL